MREPGDSIRTGDSNREGPSPLWIVQVPDLARDWVGLRIPLPTTHGLSPHVYPRWNGTMGYMGGPWGVHGRIQSNDGRQDAPTGRKPLGR